MFLQSEGLEEGDRRLNFDQKINGEESNNKMEGIWDYEANDILKE